MKNFLVATVTLFAALFATSCSNSEELIAASQDAQGTNVTRNVGVKTPKLTTYIETNDINPLNMGEYYFTGTDEQVVDHVILFASNIRGTVSTVELYHNPNQTYILNHASTLIKPLQDKGIKVLLGLLGDHTGVGFANLTAAQRTSFAEQIAACVKTYGLDGVDFDDEYAEYGRISGTPSPSSTNFGLLIQKVRELLPADKLVTAFYYGGNTYFDQTSMNALSYMWPDFTASASAPSGLQNGKWARMSIHYTDRRPSASAIKRTAQNFGDYGAIMMFNLRNEDCSGMMNNFAPYVWGGKTVSYTGISHSKNY